MAKAGRPQIKIDKAQFEKLCALQCTELEIAAYFGCSEDTIERWCKREFKQNFADVFAEKRGLGKISLRRNQWRLSETNPTMAIWLGKQYLDQKDSTAITVKQEIEPEAVAAVEALIYADNERPGSDSPMADE